MNFLNILLNSVCILGAVIVLSISFIIVLETINFFRLNKTRLAQQKKEMEFLDKYLKK